MTPIQASAGAIRCPATIAFDTIKRRAQRIFGTAVDGEISLRTRHREGHSPSYRVLLPFVCMVAIERDALHAFVLSLAPPVHHDALAQQARWHAERDLPHWSQLLLQVRETGRQRINHWDVRCVGRLITLFPGCVPKPWRHAALRCQVGEPSGRWLVSLAPHPAPAIEAMPIPA